MKPPLNNALRLGPIGLSLLLFIGCLRAIGGQIDVSKLPTPATNKINFTRDIKPILEENCLRCHGPEKPRNGFRLDNRNAALKGGENGVDILPGNSAKSPLIHNVAYLVEDSEMPPIGKGKRLTSNQISLLRAWIDQGTVWDTGTNNPLDFAFSPVFGATGVSGNKQKYRELMWLPGGQDDGVENFSVFKQINPDTKLAVDGHALVADYEVNLSLDRAGLGFVHSGWEQYRKYYNDVGAYYPALAPSAPRLGEDLYLDIGKAWIDVGVTVPDWPRLVLGYEYDYRQGHEATTEWNYVGTSPNTVRNMAPASEALHEGVHVIKADLDYEVKGVTLEDRFRAEFYHLSTGSTNAGYSTGPASIGVNENSSYVQGANTFRMEKKFAEWLMASAGYAYSKLDAESGIQLQMDTPTLLQFADAPQITLERESHVGNINVLLGPVAGMTLSAGALADWTRQSGFGPGLFDQQTIVPFSNFTAPFTVDSDYDQTTVQEMVGLRYSKIPFTSLFADARLEQQNIGQFDDFAASQNILNKAVFQQHTDFRSRSSDWRAGFETSPWRYVSLNGHYRHYDDDSDYDSSKLVQPSPTAYPTFIRARDLNTDEVEARLVLHPASFLKTTLSYQYHDTRYDVKTGPFAPFANVIISPGGELLSGAERGQVYSLSATVTPVARLYLTGTISYQDSTLTTAYVGANGVVPYVGDTYTLLVNGTYILSDTTDLFVSYLFSEANYGESDFAKGLPLGIEYRRHSAQIGISKKLAKTASAKLLYRFDTYAEPSSGGANNFTAHSVYCTLAFQFP